MSRIAKCPHCKKPLDGPLTPSQIKRQAEVEAAAMRRAQREREAEARRWYAADFKIIYDRVNHIKMSQAKPGEAVSPLLFQSILNFQAAELNKLEKEIKEKAAR